MDFSNSTASGNSDIADTVGSAEILRRAGVSDTVEVRRHLGAVIRYQSITNGAVGASNERYVFPDAQGSPHRITNSLGETNAEGQQWFASFGKRANSSTGVAMSEGAIRQFTALHSKRGYTGHEHADPVGLIHMNGRMYDPMTGRFLQADPFVQDPMNLQSLNRYSYVLNNPFAYTDPSGYWGKKEQGYLRTAVVVAIAVWTGYYINTTALTAGEAMSVAAAGGAASGAVATGTLRGAVIGAFSGAIGHQISITYAAGSYQNILGSAIQGGIVEELSGGKFGHGFVSAGLSAGIAPQIRSGNRFQQGVARSMLGGTMSAISGGKFANGAITGAFSYALGELANDFVSSGGGSEKIVTDTSIGQAASEVANKFLGDALNVIHESMDAAAAIWQDAVQPVAELFDTEILSKFFAVPGGFRIGPAYSSGVICSQSTRCTVIFNNAPDVRGAILISGYIHTHPVNKGFSGEDLLLAKNLYSPRKFISQLTSHCLMESCGHGRLNP